MDNVTFLLPALREALVIYIIFIASMCLRSWGQAFVADLLGDPLPRLQNRVTLNPFAHMDLFGSVLFPLIALFWPIFVGGMRMPLFAWSKPIELALLNPKTRVRNEVCVAATGPGVHLFLCALWALIGGFIARFFPHLIGLVLIGIQLNATLAFFNLLPIPPFDGGTLVRYLFRMKDEWFMALSRYSLLIFLLLISLPMARNFIYAAITLIDFPFRLLFAKILVTG